MVAVPSWLIPLPAPLGMVILLATFPPPLQTIQDKGLLVVPWAVSPGGEGESGVKMQLAPGQSRSLSRQAGRETMPETVRE